MNHIAPRPNGHDRDEGAMCPIPCGGGTVHATDRISGAPASAALGRRLAMTPTWLLALILTLGPQATTKDHL